MIATLPRRAAAELGLTRKSLYRRIEKYGLRLKEGRDFEIVNIDDDPRYKDYWQTYHQLTERKGELTDMRPSGVGRTRIQLLVPTRSLIGYQPELLSDTRGTAIFNRLFHAYEPYRGEIAGRTSSPCATTASPRCGRRRTAFVFAATVRGSSYSPTAFGTRA